jgi:cbb3-type cytochrome oxidase maturation protein
MTIIIMLILISLVIAVCFLIAFILILKSGQYDDTYSPSVRMLFDDKVEEGTDQLRKESERSKTQLQKDDIEL